jgi:hypothetical protein
MQLAPPPDNAFLQPITSRILEARTITPYDYRAVVLPLYTTLSSSQLRGSASYTIPTNMKMRVRQIQAHIAVVNPADAAEAGVGLYAADVNAQARLYAKAMNCRASLAFQSRTFDVFPQFAFPLSDLMSQNGVVTTFLDMPGTLIAGTTIDLNVSLTDSGAALSATEYGIVLVGSLIRVD